MKLKLQHPVDIDTLIAFLTNVGNTMKNNKIDDKTIQSAINDLSKWYAKYIVAKKQTNK